MIKSLILSAAVMATFLATGARADSSGKLPSRVVHLADLDLTTPHGKRVADRRIASAASEVCGGWNVGPLSLLMPFERCRTTALAQARRQLDVKVARAVANAERIQLAQAR